jgi:hypothetical protein
VLALSRACVNANFHTTVLVCRRDCLLEFLRCVLLTYMRVFVPASWLAGVFAYRRACVQVVLCAGLLV